MTCRVLGWAFFWIVVEAVLLSIPLRATSGYTASSRWAATQHISRSTTTGPFPAAGRRSIADRSARRRGLSSIRASSSDQTGPKDDPLDQFLESASAVLMLDQTNNHGEQQSPFSFVIQSRNSSTTKKPQAGGDLLRGTIRRIEGRLVQLSSKTNGHRNIVTQVTFKYHGATDIAKNWSMSDTVSNLAMILRGQADSTGNVLPKTEWDDDCHHLQPNSKKMQLLPSKMIQSAEIEAGGKIYRWSNNGKAAPTFSILASSSPSSSANSTTAGPTTTTIPMHDRVRQTILAVDHPVWAAIGIANRQTGIIKPTMAAKYRQCQKFVEIVSRLVPAASAADNNNNNSQQRNITVVDMGCGRGYLTFALHAHLTEEETNRRCVTTKGIDVRPKLVADMNTVARTLRMEGLSFECGTIDDFLQQQQQQQQQQLPSPHYPDDTAASSSSVIRSQAGDDDDDDDDDSDFSVVIALHACDTATDDALWYGITQRADSLVVAPCCHKQVRPQLDQVVAKHPDHPYADILQHGIYRERLAETVTDTLRALLLELCGYQVQVFEFIGGEHTSKNVMITARKKPIPLLDEQKNNLTIRIQSLAQLHGIRHQSLANRMGLLLSAGGPTRSSTARKQDRAIAINGMPALSKKGSSRL
jgi:Methyltransferase domain